VPISNRYTPFGVIMVRFIFENIVTMFGCLGRYFVNERVVTLVRKFMTSYYNTTHHCL
jgi:hypothetical protein